MSAEEPQEVVLRLTGGELRALDAELPAGDAETVRTGLEAMRATWARGNACLT
jgi:hypothetical protein